MDVVVFDLGGPLAHFRRPDTMATHATYPIMPPTALRGLVGSILGLEFRDDGDILTPEDRLGLRLLGPVRTVVQELSLHGKKWLGSGEDASFHRPTAIEYIVNPAYRAYYAGPRAEELSGRLERGESVFHTYLGCAYCLTFPRWVGRHESAPSATGHVRCVTVVPSVAARLGEPEEQAQYARVGGVSLNHIGGRRFRGSVAVLYERQGWPIPLDPLAGDWDFVEVPGEGTVCLW